MKEVFGFNPLPSQTKEEIISLSEQSGRHACFNPLPSQTKEEISSNFWRKQFSKSFNPLPSQTKEEIAAIKVLIYVLEKALLTFLDIIIANLIYHAI